MRVRMYEVVRGFFCAKQCLPHTGVQSFECLTKTNHIFVNMCISVFEGQYLETILLPVRKPEMSSWEEPEVTGKERRSKMHVF